MPQWNTQIVKCWAGWVNTYISRCLTELGNCNTWLLSEHSSRQQTPRWRIPRFQYISASVHVSSKDVVYGQYMYGDFALHNQWLKQQNGSCRRPSYLQKWLLVLSVLHKVKTPFFTINSFSPSTHIYIIHIGQPEKTESYCFHIQQIVLKYWCIMHKLYLNTTMHFRLKCMDLCVI